MSPPGVASGSPMPGVGGGGAGGSPATGPASSPAVRGNVTRQMLRLSLAVAAVPGPGLVVLTGCAPDAPAVAVPAIGDQLTKAGAAIGVTAAQVDAAPVPVPVPGSKSCPLLDPDHDGVLCNE